MDEVKAKYAKAVSDINKQNDIIVKLKQELSNVNQELNDKNRQGITILEHQGYKVYIKILENNIKNEEEKLIGLQKIEQRRRKELIAAKTDVMSIEKIREKRFEEYVKEETKKEELGIEEFVSNQLSSRK